MREIYGVNIGILDIKGTARRYENVPKKLLRTYNQTTHDEVHKIFSGFLRVFYIHLDRSEFYENCLPLESNKNRGFQP